MKKYNAILEAMQQPKEEKRHLRSTVELAAMLAKVEATLQRLQAHLESQDSIAVKEREVLDKLNAVL